MDLLVLGEGVLDSMKKLRTHDTRARKAVCTVSAAALMLGVGQAVTIGFNFQCNYCAAPSYSGAVVTAPAFGVPTNSWQSLPQMDTGYGCTPDYYVLDQVIDPSTPTGTGLNPLPKGSIHVTWSAYTANVSGFGGYDRSGPHYTFGGNGYNPGNEQVYWGFLRDGVNFGPGSSGGDNDQPGYKIDITGLKSIFAGNPFAIELIASTDSMQTLTNVSIIDATANTTQTVFYPSTPPVDDHGDTAWVRGIGGGLSTASDALDTDHIEIIGNRAAHGGDKTNGFNNASTIAGFIVTDKPVISMPPNQVVVCPGDTVVWSAYAVGVPPLAYQWRKDGVPIPGATNTSLGLTNVAMADAASYDVQVTNLYGSAISTPVTLDQIAINPGQNFIVDSSTNGAPHTGFNFGATWLASSTDGAGTTRAGVMQFSAATPGQIVVPGEPAFDTAAGSISFWMRSSGPTNASGNPAILFDRRLGSKGMVLALNGDGTLEAQTTGSSDTLVSAATVADNNWHNIALTWDTNFDVTLYVDGALDNTFFSTAWSWQSGQEIELGLSHDSFWQPFDGMLDDFRFYNQTLTDSQIASIHASDALADPSALVLWLNFDAAPSAGATLSWQCPDAVLQSADSVSGPYTDIPGATSPYPVLTQQSAKFYRYHGHTPTTVVANPYLM